MNNIFEWWSLGLIISVPSRTGVVVVEVEVVVEVVVVDDVLVEVLVVVVLVVVVDVVVVTVVAATFRSKIQKKHFTLNNLLL